MDIRQAQVEDVPAVLPMVAAICAMHEQLDPAKYGFLPQPERRYEGWLTGRARDPRSVFLVADRGQGQLAAFLVGTIEQEIPIYRLSEFGFIHDVWVEPAYRNEGLARQLVALAVERFKQLGVRQVRCDVAQANDVSRKLFDACGFRPCITQLLIEL